MLRGTRRACTASAGGIRGPVSARHRLALLRAKGPLALNALAYAIRVLGYTGRASLQPPAWLCFAELS